jgi:hypothetical protein
MNMKTQAIFLSCFFSIAFLALPSADAQPGPWEKLGFAKVHGGVDHDEIEVTRLRGLFSEIKLAVENEGVEFDRVVVHFANGGKEEVAIRNFIPAGGETRAIDLRGNDRIIRRVVFYYKSNPLTDVKGKVVLYGRN